ncbi:MAG: hypothetical protein JO112_00845 [Planctomycetes bacterium]|nr:hypothetical protein [Planctomycetota bacterium]
MTNPQPKDEGQKQPASPSVPDDQTTLPPAGEVAVNYESNAVPAPPGKTIHRRRPLPPIPDKKMEE